MNQEILQKLSTLSTPIISDAMDSCGLEGALLGIKPLKKGLKLIGPAYTIKYSAYQEEKTDFKSAANYIDNVPAYSVVVIDNEGREDCTVWGDILTQTAILKRISGAIINGAVRDVDLIEQHNYPLYCKYVYMRSGKNRVYKSAQQIPLLIDGITIHPGDMVFADDNGVIVIPKQRIDEIAIKSKIIQTTEQKIVSAIKDGLSLEQARNEFGYDKPWEEKVK